MLKSPRFNRYKNPICLAFTSNVLEVLTDNAIAELATVTTDLQDAHDEMTAAFKKDLGSIKTLSLKELDKRRDDAIRGIAAVARGYEVHFDTTKKDAGMVIGRSIRKYAKSIAQLSY